MSMVERGFAGFGRHIFETVFGSDDDNEDRSMMRQVPKKIYRKPKKVYVMKREKAANQIYLNNCNIQINFNLGERYEK
jgi:hypothetical protein